MRILLLTVLGCVALGGAATPGSCGLMLNEIMADPARDWDGNGTYNYRDDEWVEVYNPGPGSLDLAGYLIGDASRIPLYGFSGNLTAGGHLVIYGSVAVAYQQAHGIGVYGLRLGNDGDTMTLLQVAGADTLLTDSYTYNTYEAEDDRSTGRYPDGSASWWIFDQYNPYTGQTPPSGTGLPPTPGGANGGVPVPAVYTTWGGVRGLYR